MPREIIDLATFHDRLKSQGVERLDLAFVCPMCGTVQSMRTLIAVGVEPDQVEQYVGFSCVGRWTNAGPPPARGEGISQGKGCDWTLGGLLQCHDLEVALPEGGGLMRTFTPASAEDTQDLARRGGVLRDAA